MGVRGLTTFINRDQNKYQRKILLRDCNLILDGCSVCSVLYQRFAKHYSGFGGDYDEYASIVKNFFELLKNSNIKAYILFDGAHETRKLDTNINRYEERLKTLKAMSGGFTKEICFPLFMQAVFYDVAVSFNVPVILCEFEGDGEIAALGRLLNCPVLSNDSDFYIYDVQFIHLSTIELSSTLSTDGLHCSMYTVAGFINQFPGLIKDHLLILVSLLGNDFVESRMLEDFLKFLPAPRDRQIAYADKRIYSILEWLKRNSVDTAVLEIKRFIGDENFEKFKMGLESCKQNYSPVCSCTVLHEADGRVVITPPQFTITSNRHVFQLLSTRKLASDLSNLLAHRSYSFSLLVEDMNQDTCQQYNIPMVLALDRLVTANDTRREVQFLIRRKETSKFEKWMNPLQPGENLESLLVSSPHARKQYICDTLSLEKEDLTCVVENFPEDCQFFFLCFGYWALISCPSVVQIHSLLLSYLGCQAKNKTGLCASQCTEQDLTKFTLLLRTYRETSQSSRKLFNISHVNSFTGLQAIIYHCSHLNSLLDSPFESCKIQESLCGTLNHNLCLRFAGGSDVLEAIHTFLSSVPSVWNLYKDLLFILSRYFPDGLTASELKKRQIKVKEDFENFSKKFRITDNNNLQ